MNCPSCGAEHLWKVVNSRPIGDLKVYRTRECKVCAIRVMTEEQIMIAVEPENRGPWYKRRKEYLENG